MDITELLAFSAKQNASDLHLSAGLPPMIRVDGDIRRLNVPAMENSDVRRLIYDIMNDRQRRDYEEHLETDFSFEVPGVARFRVNAFNQARGAGAVFRTIPNKVLSMDALGMGEVFQRLSMLPRGLVLVTGPRRAKHDLGGDDRLHQRTALRAYSDHRRSGGVCAHQQALPD